VRASRAPARSPAVVCENGPILKRHPMAIEDLPSRTFGPGDVIFRQGDNSHGEAYLVHEGSVEVRRLVDGEDRVLRTLAKGDLLGEVALFRDAPHSATAVALEETTLIAIPADRLEHMVTSNPRLAIALIRQLARMAAGDVEDPAQESGADRPRSDR
jgi:CRP-like cAMP-binding protein